MKAGTLQVVDPRRAPEIIEELLARRPGYVPEWVPPDAGPERALIWIYARYLEAVLERLNQVPQKSLLAFLELLGVELIPAQAARAPIVFRLGADAPDVSLPAGSRVAAPPPPESSEQIVFETERAIGLSAARLAQVVSLWPGRDQSIDHTAAFLAGEVIQPFRRAQLADTPHILYIAHDSLLALAGKVRLDVELDLTQVSSEPLATAWEYWDGKIWREFARQRPECGETGGIPPDGTAGFTRSGKARLETDCAETQKTTVGGIEAFWIRGRLDEPLPLVPDQILPEVSRVGLTSVIERDLKVILTGFKVRYEQGSQVACVLTDTAGRPVVKAQVELVGTGVLGVTNDEGQVLLPVFLAPNVEYTLEVSAFGTQFTRAVLFDPPDAGRRRLELELTLEVGGLQPDPAFADAQKVDLSRPFYPFGQQPQPGSTFYFSSEEAFTKPGARLSVHVQKTDTPQDQAAVSGGGTDPDPLDHRVSWEYWNGERWAQILFYSNSGATSTDLKYSPRDFTDHGVVELVVPEDMAAVEVNKQKGLWMRVRLLGGAFGFTQKVTWKDASNHDNAFTFVVAKPPALSDFRLSYVWEYGPFPPQRVLAFNDFQYTDRTEQAQWPGEPFPPFQQIADATPALHLGFDKKLPVDRVSLFFAIVERPGGAAPALVWEHWNGFRWRPVAVEDETRDLRYPGTVSLIGPEDSRSVARFGTELYWLRARLAEDGPPAEPEIRGIHLNAALAAQRQTIVQENLGTSNGRPGQFFAFRRIPVLAGERLEVREVAGPRANVEWRILALEVLGGGQRGQQTLREIEALLGREGLLTDVELGDLRLRRDRDKRVTEVWVRWQPRRHLLGSGPGDRHYVLERATGRVAFGDGEHGKVPPLGAQLLAREYRSGGGASGNVAAGAIKSLLSGVAGVEAVFNPIPAEGGADAETAAAFVRRGPRTVRHRGRAISAGDFEIMAQEASPAVAVARALPALDPEGRARPGWITLIVIPKSEDRRPQPSFGLREQVRQAIERRAAAELAAGLRLHLTGPTYRPVDVEATVAPLDPAAAGEVEKAARRALEGFLHPLSGGPEGAGWEPGRHVFLSDVAAVLERVPGVDYVRDLVLLLDGAPQGESARVASGVIAAAGEIRIRLALEVCR